MQANRQLFKRIIIFIENSREIKASNQHSLSINLQ